MAKTEKLVLIFLETLNNKNSTPVFKKHGLSYQKAVEIAEKYNLPYTAVEDAFDLAILSIDNKHEFKSINAFFKKVIYNLEEKATKKAALDGVNPRYFVVKRSDLEDMILNSKYFWNVFVKNCTKDSYNNFRSYHIDTVIDSIKLIEKFKILN